MKELKNPPEEYKDAYEAISELYDTYISLTNLATVQSGSLQTFSANFNEADTETLNCYIFSNLGYNILLTLVRLTDIL